MIPHTCISFNIRRYLTSSWSDSFVWQIMVVSPASLAYSSIPKMHSEKKELDRSGTRIPTILVSILALRTSSPAVTWSCLIASSTFFLVSGFTCSDWCNTLETVAAETLAFFAISLTFTAIRFPFCGFCFIRLFLVISFHFFFIFLYNHTFCTK